MAEMMTEADLNKRLKPLLDDVIKRKVALNDAEASENRRITEDTIQAIVEAMKAADPLFKCVYQKFVFTGSYFESLRVKAADEFDINMVLKLPFKVEDVEISLLNEKSDYVRYKLKRNPKDLLETHPKWESGEYKQVVKFFDEQRYLKRDAVQRWVQGVISKAFPPVGTFRLPRSVTQVRKSQSGPAFTYYIYTRSGRKIDVDLVPVIDGVMFNLPPKIHKSPRFSQLPAATKTVWYLIPKPYKGVPIPNVDEGTPWRVSLPEAEKQLLRDTGCLTILIKLFKLLRDNETSWSHIASYHIKTFFLLEYDAHPSNTYWKQNDLGTLYLRSLENFKKMISERYIPYYFNRKTNLISTRDFHANSTEDIKNRINRMIELVKKNPSVVTSFYRM